MSENEEIVTVNGAPLLIKGGDRDVIVRISDLEYCITAIRKLQEHKARAHLEQIVDRAQSPAQNVLGIKLLEWKPAALHRAYGLVVDIALTPFGSYRILKGSQGRFEVYFGEIVLSGSMNDKAEATAFAQRDWEKHIRTALAATEGSADA